MNGASHRDHNNQGYRGGHHGGYQGAGSGRGGYHASGYSNGSGMKGPSTRNPESRVENDFNGSPSFETH